MPSSSTPSRKLGVEEEGFYASVYGSARNGTLAELRRKGCSEEEAEEFFAMALAKVMEAVDPIARGFSAPEMVIFIKRSAWRCMIDARRRQGRRPEVELGAVGSLANTSAESPEEIAEAHEALAVGREALQMLSERDRLIFRQRHQMDLSPEEILQNMPGLSMRTYRKVIQRANARVLDALERIEGGARCEEMEGSILRRYVVGESSEAERLEVGAHLAHCRACQQVQARMRGYLVDVAGALVAASSLRGHQRVGVLGDLPARLTEGFANGAQSVGDVTRVARERVREIMLRVAGGAPGSGGDAAVGQALTATSAKVAAACAASVAAGACVAAVVPGVGGLGLLSQGAHGARLPERPARTRPAAKPASKIDALPTVSSTPPAKPKVKQSGGSKEATPSVSSSAPSSAAPSSTVPSLPSEAKESGSVTGTEFGAESGQPASQPPSTPSTSSGSGGGGGSSGGQGGSSNSASSEFGL